MVLVEPESNRTLSILLDAQLPMSLQVATVYDNNLVALWLILVVQAQKLDRIL